MAQLSNPKHEAFAYALAKGMSKQDAYVYAGYNDSPASATRLSQKPEVVKRVNELREEMLAAATAIIEAPTEENALALAAHGLTLDWCVEQFKDIADKAKSAGQFAPANAAIKNIQSIIEMKSAKSDGKDRDDEEPLIKLSDATKFAEALANLRTTHPEGVGGPTLIDVSPGTSSEDVKEIFPDDANNAA